MSTTATLPRESGTVPYAAYQKERQRRIEAEEERDRWRDKAREVQAQLSRFTTFIGCSKLTEGQRVRIWALLQVVAASPADSDGWRLLNLFDVVSVAGISSTPKDSSPEAKRRAAKNAASIASRALAFAAKLGVLERTEPLYHHDDPEDPYRITGSSARARLNMTPDEALREIALAMPPRRAQRTRGMHVEPPECPGCGSRKHMHMKCADCGYCCTGEEWVELTIQKRIEKMDGPTTVDAIDLQKAQIKKDGENTGEGDEESIELDRVAARKAPKDPIPPRPSFLHPNLDEIPEPLKQHRQWVCWRAELRWRMTDGARTAEWTKVPICPTDGRRASTNDPATWGSFAEAVSTYSAGALDGIGFVFTNDDPYAGVDFDSLDADSRENFTALASYTEYSPKERGVHVLVEAVKPGPGCCASGVEMYDRRHYFTVTGHRVPEAPTTIEPRQAELAQLYERAFHAVSPELQREHDAVPELSTDDRELLRRAMGSPNGLAFSRLWSGDLSGFPSASEADWRMCLYLKYWTNGNAEQMDRLFRNSSLYDRGKWDRPDGTWGTYGKRTIGKVLGFG